MYCKHCGAQISDDSVFCDKCGKPVRAIAKDTELSNQAQENGQNISAPDNSDQQLPGGEQIIPVPDSGGDKKRAVILGVIIAVLLVVIAVLALRFKPVETAEPDPEVVSSEEPTAEPSKQLDSTPSVDVIVGMWDLMGIVDDGEVTLTSSADVYINIKVGGTFYLKLNDTSYEGEWERYTGDLDSDTDLIPYIATFENGNTTVLAYSEEEERIFLQVNDMTGVFER